MPVPIGDLALFAASLQRTGKPYLQDFLVFYDELCTAAVFQLGWTPYAPDIGHRPVDSRMDIKADIFIELPLHPSLEPMETMCAMLPLDTLRTLSVSIKHAGWSAASWLAAFGRCSALEHVYLEGDINVIQFFKALLRPADGGPAPPNGDFLEPNQWFLWSLRSVTMSDINSSHMVDSPDTQGIMLIDYLKACLQRRAGYVQKAIDGGMVEGVDGRLPKLCINASSILKDHVSGLADFVQEIDWDEAENQSV